MKLTVETTKQQRPCVLCKREILRNEPCLVIATRYDRGSVHASCLKQIVEPLLQTAEVK
jgi:hypothetical protein